MQRKLSFLLVLLLVLQSQIIGQSFNGKWDYIPGKSTQIDLFNTVSLDIANGPGFMTIIRTWGKGSSTFVDTLTIRTDGEPTSTKISSRNFPTNVFSGVKVLADKPRTIRGNLNSSKGILNFTETFMAGVSQGEVEIRTEHSIRYDNERDMLTWEMVRPLRGAENKILFYMKRPGARTATFHRMEDAWSIQNGLPEQACWISLQGIANREKENLYFVYPETWDFRFTPDMLNYLQKDHFYTFSELKTLKDGITRYRDMIKGCIVWDKSSRSSLVVSYTVAGLSDALVVTEDLIPMMNELDIKILKDFRGQFTGKSDAEIYRWAWNTYGDECSRDYIVWLGGEAGQMMKPGVADWGMIKRAFFTDLSTEPIDKDEYQLADQILGGMKDMAMVFGWHSYAKDKERHHVTLCSSHGLRVEGLHTLPNMSFTSKVKVSPGFEFKNHHNVEAGKRYLPENKVYIACVQTDCLGLGAWNRPGRGEIPYAWEVTMNWVWLAPAMMEYFYSQATSNDYFIGALGGPGYMYPKAIPEEKLPGLVAEAYRLMKILDLNVFEIMDYSEGATIEGNTEIPERIAETYLKGMPGILGLLNGYAPAFTFGKPQGTPFISFDYYLSPDRPEAESVADIRELAAMNSERPYFLLMHVRQWSDITRVKAILDQLGDGYEIVPLDIFLKMAKEKQTYTERFL